MASSSRAPAPSSACRSRRRRQLGQQVDGPRGQRRATGAMDTTFSGDGKAEVPDDQAEHLRHAARHARPDRRQDRARRHPAPAPSPSARFTAAGVARRHLQRRRRADRPVERGGAGLQAAGPEGRQDRRSAGYAYATGRSDTDYAAVRFTSAGALDTTFSADGKVLVDTAARSSTTPPSARHWPRTTRSCSAASATPRPAWTWAPSASTGTARRTSPSASTAGPPPRTLNVQNEQIESVTIGHRATASTASARTSTAGHGRLPG